MSSLLSLSFRSLRSRTNLNKWMLYCAPGVILSAGAYSYHNVANQASAASLQPMQTGPTQLHNSQSASRSHTFSRLTIPAGKAAVIVDESANTDKRLDHILIAVHGQGEVQYSSPQEDTIVFGHDNIVLMHEPRQKIVSRSLKSGNSFSMPCTKWHQIVNQHDSDDLVIVVTSVPHKDSK